MLCLVRSSPPRLSSLSQVPELTPTTPLKCPFSGPVARLPVMRIRVFIMTPNMLLVCAWARSKPTRMTGYGLPCDMCTATQGTWGMNVPTMPPHLGHSALCLVTTLLRVGFVITLIPLLVLVLATTLAKSWKNCVTLELKQHRYLRTGLSTVFLIGLSLNFAHALHHMLFVLSPFPMLSSFTVPCCTSCEPWTAQLRVFLPLRVLEKVSRTTCGIL